MLFAVDDDGLLLSPDIAEGQVLDLVVDGIRVWSFNTSSARKQSGTWSRVGWPPALAPRMVGRGSVTLRRSADGLLFGTLPVALNGGTEPLRLTDARGRRLMVNKWGGLGVAFEGNDASVKTRLLDSMERLLEDIRTHSEVAPFVTYGTLLGAVRQGDLLPHDDDGDLAYLSRHQHPADVVIENYELERELRGCGYDVLRHSGGHLQLRFGKPFALDYYIDIFTCLAVEGWFYQAFHVRTPEDAVKINPLSQVSIDGRDFPAPHEPAGLLAACYGPSWAVPDPSFKFRTPVEVNVRLGPWLGDLHMHPDYWDRFYAGKTAADVPATPSPFAEWTANQLDAEVPVVELGSGTGRDAVFLASRGHRVLGLDSASTSVELASRRAAAEGVNARFRRLNLDDRHAVLELAGDVSETMPGAHVYARFLIHAVHDQARGNVWLLLSSLLRSGGKAWLEFRTGKDEGQEHVFGEHFRRYLSTSQVTSEIESAGLHLVSVEEGYGFAPFRDEDPHCARLVISSAGPS